MCETVRVVRPNVVVHSIGERQTPCPVSISDICHGHFTKHHGLREASWPLQTDFSHSLDRFREGFSRMPKTLKTGRFPFSKLILDCYFSICYLKRCIVMSLIGHAKRHDSN